MTPLLSRLRSDRLNSPRPLLAWACLLFLGVFLPGCAGSRSSAPAIPGQGVAGEPLALLQTADSALARSAGPEAREGYRRAAAIAKRTHDAPLEARAEVGFGVASLEMGEADDARRSLLRAVDLAPASAAAHTGMGRFYAAARRYHDAKAEFERAASLDSLDPEPLYRLGTAYAEAGEAKLAEKTLAAALARDPGHAPSRAALRSVRTAIYQSAGLPPEYPEVAERPTLSRGDLGVMLAIELGQDPDRPSWRAGVARPSETPEARGAWGERWLRVSIAKGWIVPFPDGTYRLGDPVTRGALALLLSEIQGGWGRPAKAMGAGEQDAPRQDSAGPPSAADPSPAFTDMGSRHYLLRTAQSAVRLGLPVRPGNRFEPWAFASGAETELALRGLAQALGAESLLPREPAAASVVR